MSERQPSEQLPPVPEWGPEHIVARLQRCRAMLNVHGLLTEAENKRISLRIYARLCEALEPQDGQ